MKNAEEMLKKMFEGPFCPVCGASLKTIGKDSAVLCGGITYYQCRKCDRYWKQEQKGLVPQAPNFTEISPLEI